MSKTFEEITKEILEAGKQFPNKWDLKTHYIDLVEEVGELGNAILIETKSKSAKRQRANVKDSFADVLFELVMLADEASINLEDQISQMLKELKTRQQNHDYENK